MIYTLTLNPAIDLFIETPKMADGVVNRTHDYDIQANGKGVNVSFVLKKLGIANVALGVGGGFTNRYIEEVLSERKIPNDFVHTQNITRINVFVKVIATDQEYKLVNSGPEVSPDEIARIMAKVKKIGSADTLVLSGSFSKGIDPAIIEEIAAISQKNQFKFVIDTSYKEVLSALKYRPYLIKPNNEELSSWFGAPSDSSNEAIVELAKKAVRAGAQNVLVSLGSQGALLVNEQEVLFGNAPKIEVMNTAGAGDTMLGTFLAGDARHLNRRENLIASLAAASDTARHAGLTAFEDLEGLKEQIRIQRL